MGVWAKRWLRSLRRLAAVALVAVLVLTGCGKQPEPPTPAEATPQTAPAEGAGGPAAQPAVADAAPPPQDAQHQPFSKATRGGDDPPAESNPPPAVTCSGKSVGKLYRDVVRLWDTIRFVTPDGRRLDYSATVETDLGTLEIALRPDLAPNHVRNFVALARAGYYDQLFFDRIRHDVAEEEGPDKAKVLDTIEAGCPLGTGDVGNGSIGYWLNPEFAPADGKVTHESGTVGACHGGEADTAACRFYITLSSAPFLDGNYTIFGKVTRGLDVARKIFMQPVIEDEQDADGNRRPEKPVQIKKVTIHTAEAEAGR
jgi:peptidyl-prolyl cis-trans isomerase B (cyclophilin B)